MVEGMCLYFFTVFSLKSTHILSPPIAFSMVEGLFLHSFLNILFYFVIDSDSKLSYCLFVNGDTGCAYMEANKLIFDMSDSNIIQKITNFIDASPQNYRLQRILKIFGVACLKNPKPVILETIIKCLRQIIEQYDSDHILKQKTIIIQEKSKYDWCKVFKNCDLLIESNKKILKLAQNTNSQTQKLTNDIKVLTKNMLGMRSDQKIMFEKFHTFIQNQETIHKDIVHIGAVQNLILEETHLMLKHYDETAIKLQQITENVKTHKKISPFVQSFYDKYIRYCAPSYSPSASPSVVVFDGQITTLYEYMKSSETNKISSLANIYENLKTIKVLSQCSHIKSNLQIDNEECSRICIQNNFLESLPIQNGSTLCVANALIICLVAMGCKDVINQVCKHICHTVPLRSLLYKSKSLEIFENMKIIYKNTIKYLRMETIEIHYQRQLKENSIANVYKSIDATKYSYSIVFSASNTSKWKHATTVLTNDAYKPLLTQSSDKDFLAKDELMAMFDTDKTLDSSYGELKKYMYMVSATDILVNQYNAWFKDSKIVHIYGVKLCDQASPTIVSLNQTIVPPTKYIGEQPIWKLQELVYVWYHGEDSILWLAKPVQIKQCPLTQNYYYLMLFAGSNNKYEWIMEDLISKKGIEAVKQGIWEDK